MSDAGFWVSLGADGKVPHLCSLPGRVEINRGIQPGAVWQCICGRQWRYLGKKRVEYGSMPDWERA